MSDNMPRLERRVGRDMHIRRHWPRKAQRRYERASAAAKRRAWRSWAAIEVHVNGERIEVRNVSWRSVPSPGTVRPASTPQRRNPLIVSLALAALMGIGGEK